MMHLMHVRARRVLLTSILAASALALLQADSPFGDLRWRFIGPFRGGRVLAVADVPDEPQHFYFGSVNGGVWETQDAGRTWIPIFDGQPVGSIGAIALAPSDPRVIYIGTGEADMRSDIAQGDGMFKSTDAGKTWRQIGLPTRSRSHASKSTLPTHRSCTWPRWGIHMARMRNAACSGCATAASTGKRSSASMTTPGGLYRSDDRGATWALASSDQRIWQRGWYFGRVTVDPSNADRIFALNTIVLRSDDAGRTFVPLEGDPTGGDFHELWIDPKNPDRQVLGTDQGTLVTLNGGRSWSSWHNQPTAQFYHVVTDNRFPYFVYGSQQDSGAAGVPSRTTTRNGINLTNFREVEPGGESDNIAPDPDDPDVIYGGRVDRLDLRTGQTRNIDPTLAFPGQHRAEWTLPLVFSTRDRRALYFGRQQVYRTDDQGAHWKPISPDLTREDPGVPPNLDAPTASLDEGHGPRRGVVYAIAPSPIVDHLIWAGTDDGLIWRTADEGAHWNNVTPAGLAAWSKIGIIDPSHHDAASAYAAIDRHRLDDFHPYIYRTHDGGSTWTLAVLDPGRRVGLAADGPDTCAADATVRTGARHPAAPGGLHRHSISEGRTRRAEPA